MSRPLITAITIGMLIFGLVAGFALGGLLAEKDPLAPREVTVRETTTNQPIIHNKTYPTKETHTEHTTQLPCKLPDTGPTLK